MTSKQRRKFSRKRELRDLLWSIGLHDYGHWEVPQFAVCKLKTQESKLCNLKAWKQGADGVDSSLGTKGLRIRSAGGEKNHDPAQLLSREPIQIFSAFFILFRPSENWMVDLETNVEILPAAEYTSANYVF